MTEEKEVNPFKPRPGARKRGVRRAIRITINAEATQKSILEEAIQKATLKVSQKRKSRIYCQSELSGTVKSIRNNVYNRSVLAGRSNSRCVETIKKK